MQMNSKCDICQYGGWWLWRLNDCHRSVWWIDADHRDACRHWFLLLNDLLPGRKERREKEQKNKRCWKEKREFRCFLSYPSSLKVFLSQCHSSIHSPWPQHFTHVITTLITSLPFPSVFLLCGLLWCCLISICVMFFRMCYLKNRDNVGILWHDINSKPYGQKMWNIVGFLSGRNSRVMYVSFSFVNSPRCSVMIPCSCLKRFRGWDVTEEPETR